MNDRRLAKAVESRPGRPPGPPTAAREDPGDDRPARSSSTWRRSTGSKRAYNYAFLHVGLQQHLIRETLTASRARWIRSLRPDPTGPTITVRPDPRAPAGWPRDPASLAMHRSAVSENIGIESPRLGQDDVRGMGKGAIGLPFTIAAFSPVSCHSSLSSIRLQTHHHVRPTSRHQIAYCTNNPSAPYRVGCRR